MLEQYHLPENSFVSSLDPRAKILVTFSWALILALLQNLPATLTGMIMTLPVLLFSGISPAFVIKRLILINGFILFLWIFLPLSTPGEPLAYVWILPISRQGISLALLITIKSNAIMLIFIILLSTLPVPDLGYALDRLRVPKKFILLLLISYRYLNVIFEEYNRLHTAAKIRGFVPKTNVHSYRTVAYLLAMVFIKSFDRAERVYQAMILRGFNGTFYSLRTFKLSMKDYIFISISVTGLALLCWLETNPHAWDSGWATIIRFASSLVSLVQGI